MYSKFKQPLIAIALSFSAAPNLASAYSLEQAVAQALADHPEIRSAYHDYRSRVEEVGIAKGDYRPSIDLNAGVGVEKYNNANNKGDFEPYDVTLTFRQLLWDGWATSANIDRTEWEAEAQRYQLIADAEDKALRVAEVYIESLKTRELLELAEANFKVHRRIYNDIRRRTESGIGSVADQVQVEARVARSQSNLLAARNNLLDSESNYLRVVGRRPLAVVNPEVDATKLPVSLEEALYLAEEFHPRVKVATTDIEAALSQYESRRGVMMPTFTIEATQQWGEDLNGSAGRTDETSAMLRMNFNLYNGGSDSAQSKQAAYQIDKSKDVRDNTLRMLTEGVRLSWSALELTLEQRIFLEEHVDAAAETVIAYEKQFRIGKRTLLDVLNTENELFEARQSYINAYYDELLAKYRVLNSTGRLLASLRVKLPEEWSESVVD
ncbi:TolC family outer membrane protein [Thaumasiovibrio subtropicus]|uniref:TolC family outer membrane protein n=1 Tax=Thaumasiovibrio subtropicus TaxID=1891207 RepID=UPI000B35C185|nr:TolC family outer membrane protein [Thaumasiovibrio subtropicus]